MSTRIELEAVLAKAQADWQRARDDFDKAQADLARANADWGKVVTDRRKAGADRRKAGSTWNNAFPDRRKAGSDRRISDSAIAAVAQAVADGQKIYVDRSKAQADYARAEAILNAAAVERGWAKAALDALNLAQK